LADGLLNGGTHTLTWNGRDSQGHAMPSGTYIVRLETESGVEARKVMLLR
jgi:flagellar hook assembly protein FlgD